MPSEEQINKVIGRQYIKFLDDEDIIKELEKRGYKCERILICRICGLPFDDKHTCPEGAKLVIQQESKASWLVWGGWAGNHDKRIDDARCSKCGYKHPTVYDSISKLSKYCGSCGSEMTVKEI